MHGIKRDRSQLSAELRNQRKEREEKKLQVYKAIDDQFFAYKKANHLSLEALELTTNLLRINPELYTAWNFRRTILDHLFIEAVNDVKETPKDLFASARVEPVSKSQVDPSDLKQGRKKDLINEDLELTIEVLRLHPKVYWIWNHRKWCLQQLPSNDIEETQKWTTEVQIVNKMLDMDARNFHGWNYRRYILTRLAVPKTMQADEALPPFPTSLTTASTRLLGEPLKSYQLKMAENEVRYTLTKIESNFSNFSAWHHRSLLLEPIWAAKGLNESQRRKERDDEFELVRQAMFVDPDDQSVWTYHSWLLSLDPSADVLRREIESVRELLELEPESKWCMISLADLLSQIKKIGYSDTNGKQPGQEARDLLQRLVTVDPDRKERYQEQISAI